MARLSPSAYVILGLLDKIGPTTPYGLDRTIAGSIGYFWSFPRSQLYAESARLTRLGLVREARETHGRRRRVLSITPSGADELNRWLATSTAEPTQIHDAALLRLFFTPPGPGVGATVARMADEQVATHRQRLARYEHLVASGQLPVGSPQRAALELGLRFERMAVDFWADLPVDPGRDT
jgi:PadR family transcriptional regulator, regulatory protein AphA